MKIHIVDDNEPFRISLKLFIEEFLKYKEVRLYSNGQEFIDNLPSSSDIVLMDINMPELNGLEATKKSTHIYSNLKVIAISQYEDLIFLRQLIESGFKGFVSKTNLFDNLERAINDVQAGKYYFPDNIKLFF